ncbi:MULTISPECIES: hydroxyphenylacetyl-CoA thioesterase PaaI [Providencia]|uniref:Hydroxyphenylacetyl-CoA thioesterase PaaI n=3 Tax=Gammaproteobacteria TaxID=1236 RepID=A0AA42FK90_9GAMM|nr:MULTISPECIES: hydroxyphenylacetyl-CoA thioesterase PaaI [Providencia]MBC8654839.1 hydroxyphenylacetyl-CoA thioesterase PaaI [Providencia vermicola]APC09950.1 Acyl-coenzyme A thioesterase PaaI [Providencia rettgeri]AVL73600.1 phenylacetic acid degradation protein PaaD [Providencia rettgeri]EIL1982834.1 hydroxyphenylacetyl-CoA thioesterase PaaI [Providencia rettgeri]EIU7558370.1 hydroxyphenylacetyl-CoA thioesterase PaaI [Providencia rettgeri]
MISVPNVTLAQQSAHMMYKDDACAKAMGMSIEKVEEGFAQLKMPITAQMLNGHKTCHGGQLFSLADTAFAYACNSQGHAAVASMCSIDFIRPGFEGDLLTAIAQMKHQGKQNGLYEVEIVNQDGKTLALFHGRSHRLGHRLVGEPS